MSQPEHLIGDHELSPTEIIDTLRTRIAITLAITPGELNTAEFYRYIDENNFAGLTFALIEGLVERKALPAQTLLETVQRRPVVLGSVYRDLNDETELRFETELFRRAPIDKQQSVLAGRPALGDPSQIRVSKWANGNQEYGFTVPINADFTVDPHRKIIYTSELGYHGEGFEIEIGGEELGSSLDIKSTADIFRQAMLDLANVAESKLVEAEAEELAGQAELHARSAGILVRQFVEARPVETIAES